MYREMLPALRGDILEIGSGLGTFSEKIIRDMSTHCHITLTEISSSYLEQLQNRFSSHNNVSIYKLDLNNKADYDKVGHEKFDTIVAMNVLEHVKNDEFTLEQLCRLLKKHGMLVVLVPCHKFLYNVIDRNVGHFRRYTKKELEHKIRKAQFSIERMFYFNMFGIIGWYLNGNLAKKTQINSAALKIFDRLVPLSQHIEKLTGKKVGLSIICYLKKEP
jgi:2-polyprenyl-3-methyl-5-hydroxy-6-metoxy-1,4-benzoquinol methylase